MKRFFLFTITLIATLKSFAASQEQVERSSPTSPCDCHTVTSWQDLRTLIMTSTVPNTDVQVDLPLCPFNIGKDHDNTKDTEHWKDIIYVSSPIHIYCKKSTPSDFCSITVIGDDCEANVNCGRQLFKFMSGMYINILHA